MVVFYEDQTHEVFFVDLGHCVPKAFALRHQEIVITGDKTIHFYFVIIKIQVPPDTFVIVTAVNINPVEILVREVVVDALRFFSVDFNLAGFGLIFEFIAHNLIVDSMVFPGPGIN